MNQSMELITNISSLESVTHIMSGLNSLSIFTAQFTIQVIKDHHQSIVNSSGCVVIHKLKYLSLKDESLFKAGAGRTV